jgi:structural maintenance of chromosome 2
VTIVFDNSDASTSPVGFEHLKQITVSRQIVIGGKNKYMINGHTVQQSQVQNLFHSVSLNVNNPHFLIMQGRITKVLNMKPPEILSMIEEAAGTRMFETKKQAALKTIEKKQEKVDEITRVIEADIDPKLSQLRGERQNYLDWSSNNAEVERLERFCLAADYVEAETRVASSAGEKAALEAELAALEEQKEVSEKEAEASRARISELEAEKEALNEGEGGIQGLKRVEQELSKELVKVNTTWKNEKDSLVAERETLASMEKQIEQNKALIVDKKAEIEALVADVSAAEVGVTQGEGHLESVREAYQNACAGKAETSNAELLSLPEQIGTWEKAAREAESALQRGRLRVKHASEQLKELKKSVKSQQSAHTAMNKEIDSLRSAVGAVEAKVAKLGYSEEEDTSARARQGALQEAASALRDRVDELSAQLEARLRFEYTSPERGFDQRRVKGMVAKLFTVPNAIHATALEVTAGGKLFQVVVDTEQTGKLLLQGGKLRKRATFIPLNKISARMVDNAKMNVARRIAAENNCNAYVALELIQYDAEMQKGMEYIFGNTIICDNPNVAKLIAFNRDVRVRTVTLDGDVYDPAGIVTGGAKTNLGVLLSRMTELTSAQASLEAKSQELGAVDKLVGRFESDAQAYARLSADLDGKTRALQNGEERLAATTFSVMTSDIDALEADILKCQADEAPFHEAVDHANAELTRLTAADSTIKKRREEAMQTMQNNVSKAQKALNELKSKASAARNKREKAVGELASLAAEIDSIKEQLSSGDKVLSKISGEVEALEAAVGSKRREYEDAHAAVLAAQAETQRTSKEIKHLVAQRDKAGKEVTSCNLEARKQQHKLDTVVKEAQTAERRLKLMLKDYPWINTEKQSFGVAGSGYDFAAHDVDASQARLKELKGNQDRLSKKVNKKVMGMIEKAESENEDLKRKKEVYTYIYTYIYIYVIVYIYTCTYDILYILMYCYIIFFMCFLCSLLHCFVFVFIF